MYQYTSKDVTRFWSKVNKDGSVPAHCPELGQCWEWIGRLTEKGYGTINCWDGLKHHDFRAHRMAWELTNGAIPEELFVLHKCDNPKCVNPNHLFLGTHQDNMDDREQKRRNKAPRGEQNGQSKLTWEQVDYIRRRYAAGGIMQKDLAREIGISRTQICLILSGKRWR